MDCTTDGVFFEHQSSQVIAAVVFASFTFVQRCGGLWSFSDTTSLNMIDIGPLPPLPPLPQVHNSTMSTRPQHSTTGTQLLFLVIMLLHNNEMRNVSDAEQSYLQDELEKLLHRVHTLEKIEALYNEKKQALILDVCVQIAIVFAFMVVSCLWVEFIRFYIKATDLKQC